MKIKQKDVVYIAGQRFAVVDTFVYLGALVRADGNISESIKARITSANRCFYGLVRHLRSKLLTKETKSKYNKYTTITEKKKILKAL